VSEHTVLTIFVAVAAVALIIQMGTLIALYKAMNNASSRVERAILRLEERSAPVLATAQTILVDAQPKISEITTNLAEASAMLRIHVAEIGDATGEIVERARLQAVRLDELVSVTVERIEDTAEFVQHTVVKPIRRIQAILQAVQAGIGFLRRSHSGGKSAVNGGSDDEEEMFI